MRLTSTCRGTLILILMGLLSVLWSCTKAPENKSVSTSNQSTQTSNSTPERTSGMPNGPGVEPGTPAAPAAAAIASADGEKAGTRVEINELKRSSDNTLTLKFAMINDGPDKLSFGYDFADKANEIKDHGSIGGIYLVDAVGKKKYFVVRDTENNCVCSRDIKDIPPKSRANLWAKFPAPPGDVQKIGVVIEHFSPLDDVPIGR